MQAGDMPLARTVCPKGQSTTADDRLDWTRAKFIAPHRHFDLQEPMHYAQSFNRPCRDDSAHDRVHRGVLHQRHCS
ncbi:MAG: hypothetical protein ACREPX_10400, partial [Rhodanobacteraceae bacterium]